MQRIVDKMKLMYYVQHEPVVGESNANIPLDQGSRLTGATNLLIWWHPNKFGQFFAASQQ